MNTKAFNNKYDTEEKRNAIINRIEKIEKQTNLVDLETGEEVSSTGDKTKNIQK